MQYLFLMEREFHELLSHEELMDTFTGQHKRQLERKGIEKQQNTTGFWNVAPLIMLQSLNSTCFHRLCTFSKIPSFSQQPIEAGTFFHVFLTHIN